jgi:phosphatidylglycerophosphatase A
MKPHSLIATFFGIGHAKYFPGTVGSVAGLVLSCWLAVDPSYQAAGCLTASVLGLWAAGAYAREKREEDPRSVVIDEVAGMMLSLLFLPVRWQVLVVGFFLFRFFDIFKPLFIRRAEELPGGWGIMADDLLAGLFTHVILRLLF